VDVKARGHEDPEEAFNSKSVNMEAEILRWDESGMTNIAFDGQYYLSVSKNTFSFSREIYNKDGTNNLLRVKTNFSYPGEKTGWYIDTIVDITNPIAPVVCNWLTPSIRRGDPDVLTDIFLYLDSNKRDNAIVRKAEILLAAGWLRYPITVTQSLLEIMFTFDGIPPQNNELIFPAKAGVQPGSQSFNVDWTPRTADFIVYKTIVSETPFVNFSITPDIFGIITNGNSGQPLPQYAIAPPSYTGLDNSFYESAMKVVFAVSDGENTEEKSLILRHICYSRTTTALTEYSLTNYPSTGYHTFYVKSNSTWNIGAVTPGGALTLPSGPSVFLNQGGAGNIYQGEPFNFRFAEGVNDGEEVTITFHDPTGNAPDTYVTIRAKAGN
jgi:hypothetical protein